MSTLDQLLDGRTAEEILPGDPGAAERLGAGLQRQGTRQSEAGADISSATVTWTGRGADAYTAGRARVAERWEASGTAFDHAGRALCTFADAFAEARAAARLGIDSFEAGMAQAEQRAWQDYQERVASMPLGSWNAPYLTPSRRQLAGVDAGRALRDQGVAAVDTAKKKVTDAGDAAARVLHGSLPAVESSGPGGGGNPEPMVPGMSTETDPIPDIDVSDEAMSPDRVRQGQLGDCWFLASAAAVAARDPEWIRQHIRRNPDGSYTVILYDNGKPVPVTVAASAARGGVRDADGNPSWLTVYEKAAAQHMGGRYADANSDFAWNGLAMVTGRDTHTKIWPALGLESIQEGLAAGEIYTASTGKHFLPGQNSHVVDQHVYIVDRVETRDGELKIHVINPWGPGNHEEGPGPEDDKPGDLWLTESEFRANFASTTRVEGRRP